MRILVADDSHFTRSLLKLRLAGSGHNVDTVVCGAEALEMLEHSVPYDVLITDNSMADSGIETIRRIRSMSEHDSLAIILSTSDRIPDLATDLQALKAEYLPKPYGINDLDAVIARVNVDAR